MTKNSENTANIEATNTPAPPLTKAESSRRNGAKSNGPQTEAGKARSCLNRTTHGMRSSRVVLHTESQELYDTLSHRFFALFTPTDIFEQECVTNLVNARWRIRRLEAADTANLNLAMEEARPEFEKKFDNLDDDHQNALAYRAIAQSAGQADLMGRYEDRQHRIFDRSYRLICKHRGRNGPFPSPQAMSETEAGLPVDNLARTPIEAAADPSDTEPDTQNRAFEPETPPSPPESARLRPQTIAKPPVTAKSSNPENEDSSFIAYPEDYAAIKPIFDALQNRPELRIAISDALVEHRCKQSNS